MLKIIWRKISYISLVTLLLIGHATGAQPEFAYPMQNVSVPVGRDASFSCVVSHLGGYRVGWVKADTKAIQAIHTHVITHNVRVSVSHTGHNTWNLNIKEVQEEDRGPYMCQINTDPMRSQIAYLEVTVPPQIIDEESSTDIMVPEGSTAILVCRAKGYPKPIVFWKREDDNKDIQIRSNNASKSNTKIKTYEGEVLNLTNIKRSDMGPYLCIANNSVPPIVSKRIMVEVHFAPGVHVPNQLISSPVGSTLILKCNIEASPKSIQYWTRADGMMLMDDNEFNVTDIHTNYYQTTMSLTILKFKKKHAGEYHCHSKNSIGEVYGLITVNALEPPTEPPKVYDELEDYDDNEIYTELSNHIPYDPKNWDHASPTYDNYPIDNEIPKIPSYNGHIPSARPTQSVFGSWNPTLSGASIQCLIPYIICLPVFILWNL